jgi:beta-lactamase class D
MTRLILVALLTGAAAQTQSPAAPATRSCFLLLDVKSGQLTRQPADLCTTRLPPASTFKVPHALAALDAGVLTGPDEVITYDGTAYEYEVWRRDHTLATAMRYSVLWFFQRVAQRLGMDREEFYLRRLRYGNADPSSGLTTFWLGGSLVISPEEQVTFLRRLYYGELPVSERAMRTVRETLLQPNGAIVNARGEHPFDAPWPPGTVVSAKTGATSYGQRRAVRWIIGHVRRADRSWIFVSCVDGGGDLDANAAIDLAARSLRAAAVL